MYVEKLKSKSSKLFLSENNPPPSYLKFKGIFFYNKIALGEKIGHVII